MTDKHEKLRYGISAFHLTVDLACVISLFAVMTWYTVKYGYDYFFGTFFGSWRRGLCFFVIADTAGCIAEIRIQEFFKLHGILNIIFSVIIFLVYFPSIHIPSWMESLFSCGTSLPFVLYLLIKKLSEKN